MRSFVFGLLYLLVFVLPLSARADSYLYTIDWNYLYSNPQYAHPELIGNYSFTTDRLPTEMVCVYAHDAIIPPALSSSCSYSSTFTTPPGSNVILMQVWYYPNYGTYGVSLGGFGFGVGSSLFQNPSDPYRFFANFGSDGFVSLQVSPLNDTPSVPEPSTFLLIGTGVLGVASRLRRRSSPSL